MIVGGGRSSSEKGVARILATRCHVPPTHQRVVAARSRACERVYGYFLARLPPEGRLE